MVVDSLLFQVLLYCFSFALIWIGSGLVVASISKLALSLRFPPFILSFFLLGILTSLPEITIGGMSLLNNDPAISVGNLLGGVIVLFLFIIPLLGFLGNGIKIPPIISQKDMIFILIVILAPSLLTSDQKVTPWEGLLLILLYACLFISFSREQNLAKKFSASLHTHSLSWSLLIGKILVGVVLLLLASRQIIISTLFFAGTFQISPFLMSLVVVSLGTNIPELSIVFRSLLQGKKDVALADYLGSAVANTPIMGGLALLHTRTITLPNHFLHRFLFLALGLVLFYFFAKSKRLISRAESGVLLLCYILFICIEFLPILITQNK